MKRQTKPMSLKKQLMSAVSMMLAAAVALGSSTYAWFVNKSRAEVTDVLFQATAGMNLEISGAVVEATGHANGAGKITGLNENDQVPQGKANLLTYWSSVTPATLGEHSFTYPEYAPSATAAPVYMKPVSVDESNLTILPTTSKFFINDQWDSTATSAGSTVGAYYTYKEVASNADKNYICAQLYFRSSTAMDVYLNKAEWDTYAGSSTTTEVATTYANDTASGLTVPFITYYNPSAATDDEKAAHKIEAEEMAKALRIAFVPGTYTDSANVQSDTALVAAFDPTNHVTGAYFNTAKTGGTGQAVIETPSPIKEIDSGTKQVSTFGTAVTKPLIDYAVESGATGAPQGDGVTVQTSGKTALFHLDANTPKRVTIYIWLEGTDEDCISVLSSYRAGVYLPFVGVVQEGSDYKTYGDDIQVLDMIEPEQNAEEAAETLPADEASEPQEVIE